MPRIVISYRRSDAAAMSGRIFDRLVTHFGKNAVFMDVDNIPFGIDFRQYINKALEETNILVVVIGPKWLGGDERGHARIMDAGDPVRIEVETALRRAVPVIPVLVDGATMPTPADLPESLELLSYRNAAEVDTGRDFHPHMDRLIRSMDKILSEGNQGEPGDTSRGKRIPISKKGAIVGVVVVCAGLTIAAAWYGLQKFNHPTPAAPPSASVTATVPQDSLSRENSAFDAAKRLGTVQAWDDFLAKVASGQYPAGPLADQARQARAKLMLAQTQAAFDEAKKANTVQAWDDFLSKINSGTYTSDALLDQARQERAKLVTEHATEAAFNQASHDGTVQAWDDFLAKVDAGEYQNGPLTDQARQARAKLVRAQRTQKAFDQAKQTGTVQAWDDFLTNVDAGEYEAGPLSDQARKERATIIAQNTQAAFERARKSGTVQAWDEFLAKVDSGEYQAGYLADQARRERDKLDQTKLEVEFWNSIKDSKNPNLFEAYLQRYPTGAFADIAKAELKNLQAATLPSSTEVANDSSPITAPGLLRELRERLYELNFDPGPLDSSDVGATAEAIREFERQNALPVTGAPSMGLLRRLRTVASLKPWGAIVYDAEREKWGMSWGEETRANAVSHAQASCDAAKPCPVEVSFFGTECAAFAHSGSGWSIVAREDIDKAKSASIADCLKRGTACRIVASVCADGRSNAAQ